MTINKFSNSDQLSSSELALCPASSMHKCFFTCFQDFELWDDVGLNIPKPPDLLQLYRNCGTPLPSPRDTIDVSVGVDFGDLPGHCVAQDTLRKPDLSQQVCVWVYMYSMGIIPQCTVHHELYFLSMLDFWLYLKGLSGILLSAASRTLLF